MKTSACMHDAGSQNCSMYAQLVSSYGSLSTLLALFDSVWTGWTAPAVSMQPASPLSFQTCVVHLVLGLITQKETLQENCRNPWSNTIKHDKRYTDIQMMCLSLIMIIKSTMFSMTIRRDNYFSTDFARASVHYHQHGLLSVSLFLKK